MEQYTYGLFTVLKKPDENEYLQNEECNINICIKMSYMSDIESNIEYITNKITLIVKTISIEKIYFLTLLDSSAFNRIVKVKTMTVIDFIKNELIIDYNKFVIWDESCRNIELIKHNNLLKLIQNIIDEHNENNKDSEINKLCNLRYSLENIYFHNEIISYKFTFDLMVYGEKYTIIATPGFADKNGSRHMEFNHDLLLTKEGGDLDVLLSDISFYNFYCNSFN